MGLLSLFGFNKKKENTTVQYEESVKTEYEKYMIAANQGNPTALYKIGIYNYSGNNGVEKNIEKAVEYFYAAISKGNIDSYYWLGLIYENGEGGSKDLKKSFECFKAGAEKGDYAAEAMLGRNYLYGIGTEQNYDLAYKWLSKSPQDLYFSGYYLGEYHALRGNHMKAIDILEKTLSSGGSANQSEARELLRKLYVQKSDSKSVQRANEIAQQQKRSNDLLDRLSELIDDEGYGSNY